MLWTIIVTLVGGTIIGLIAKAVAPGDRDKIPLWLTTVCGIVGMLAGSYLYWAVAGSNNPNFDGHEATADNVTNGIDWLRHLWQVAVAAVAVIAAAAITGRNKSGA
ncbi:GlsB/YeaQ/YmgE family stress response membrane protein [Nocardioides sp. CPCC 206347]|uniref:GlsB/YeaQ/YmgE family stress response membrane protein n=1 Tax=unclassified Nocardioides TaxID=2615069 RepID=UPI003608644F